MEAPALFRNAPHPDVRWIWAATALALAIAVAATCVWVAANGPAFRLDDAYIVLNNAEAILVPDASFPEVAPLHGSTSLLHSLAVFALSLVLPPEAALFVLSWSALLALALAALALARDLGLPLWFAVALAIAAASAGDVLRVQVNGLETGWMTAAVLWTLVLANRTPTGPALAALAACLPFIRPELALLSLLVASRAGIRMIRAERYRDLSVTVLVFAAVAGTLSLLQFHLAGTPLPLTGSAKRYFFEDIPLSVGARVAIGVTALSGFAMALGPLILALVLPRAPVARLGLAFGAATILALTLAHPAIISQNWYRYLYFLLPLCIANLAFLRSEGGLFKPISTAILLATLLFSSVQHLGTAGAKTRTLEGKRETLAATAEWITRELPPGEHLILHDIGYMAWATSRPLYDIVGLREPEAVRINKTLRHKKGEPGLADALDAMVRTSGSCTLLASPAWNANLGIARSLQLKGWQVSPHKAGNPPGHVAFHLSGPPGAPCQPSES